MQVVFRADASVTIGTGHVMRCLTLADMLRTRGAECHFVTRNLPGHLGTIIAQRGFSLSLLDAPTCRAPAGPPDHAGWAGVTWQQDLADTGSVIAEADWLVVDHYAFDARWERGLMGKVGRIMVIDDLADRPHVAELLLDQNLGREEQDYDELVPDTCRQLIGPRYALLRPEFAERRPNALERRKNALPSHLLISMGGIDAVDATSTALTALKHAQLPDDLRISVVMGSRAPSLERVHTLAASMPWLTDVLVDVVDMADLMAEADIAIGAGGSTTWERCCLGLPSIIVETAANQSGAVTTMEQAGAALGTGPLADLNFDERLIDVVFRVIQMPSELSARAADICDGHGARRVADALQFGAIEVRPARSDDGQDVWRWRNDPAALAFYLTPEPTPFVDHMIWFEKALVSELRDLLIVEVDGIPAAHVRLDKVVGKPNEVEVSICMNPDFRGQGLGSIVLWAALDSLHANSFKCVLARVHCNNRPSVNIFTRMGFKEIGQDGPFLKFELLKRSCADTPQIPEGTANL